MERELHVVLIEDDPVACKEFKEYIDTVPDVLLVEITNNSYRAIEIVRDSQPDAIILDLELHEGQGNGLLFLQELKKLSLIHTPYVLVTTNNSSSTTYEAARHLGTDFIMFKHQQDYSSASAVEFLRMMKDIIQSRYAQDQNDSGMELSIEQSTKRIERMITAELDFIGISPKAVGYKYLSDAIFLVIKDRPSNICTELGKRYKKTDSSVERAMQNAINRAWRNTDIDELMTHYKAKINSEKGVPTLTEFIHYYAKKVKSYL